MKLNCRNCNELPKVKFDKNVTEFYCDPECYFEFMMKRSSEISEPLYEVKLVNGHMIKVDELNQLV